MWNDDERLWRALTVGAAVCFSAAAPACFGSAPEDPAPRAPDIVRRHWDQVCLERGRVPAYIQLEELFDTVGLGRELEERDLLRSEDEDPGRHVDFVSRYGTDGRVAVSGTWEGTVDDGEALQVEEVLQGRMRRLSGLLVPEGFRSRLHLANQPLLELARPIECMPHMVHVQGFRPIGMPDTVVTWGGHRLRRDALEHSVALTITIGLEGEILGVEKVEGSDEAFREIDRILRGMWFDPPLRNGEPIQAELEQSFRFDRSGRSP